MASQSDIPPDARLLLTRDTTTPFEMTRFADKETWEAYAEALRRRLLVASGLCPLPERTPLNPMVTRVASHADYIVEKVAIEAMPGFLVTGNLYRPVGNGPHPGVACPHGHWRDGRLADGEDMGRPGRCVSVPGRCITFARMGMVAFSYDIVGCNDSLQMPFKWGHGEGCADWGPDVRRPRELWGIHPFGLQLWSSIRVLDFVEGLPYVDGDRLACTGASGGGTQTFALAAVDQRVKVSAPVNMISHVRQGGCPCENAPIIRFEASNMEIGALTAPRPMIMVSATGDWTRHTPEVEFPAVRGVYELYGAGDRVENVHVDAPHNYNRESREAVYRFFGKWLLGKGEEYADFEEPAYDVEPKESLRLFPNDELPEGTKDAETIVAEAIARRQTKWAAILPRNPDGLETFRADYGVALADVTGASIPDAVAAEGKSETQRDGYAIGRFALSRPGEGDLVPALLYLPDTPVGCMLAVHEAGKAALADSHSGAPGPLIEAQLSRSRAVLAIDAFLTGESRGPADRSRSAYPDTFMPTDTACRIQDIVTALAYLAARQDLGPEIDLVGLADAGMWCLFASALCGVPRRTVIDANRFANNDDEAWVARHYVPCLRAIGDVATAAALIAPRDLILMNTGEVLDASDMKRVYEAASGKALRVDEAPMSGEALQNVLARHGAAAGT